MSEMITKNHALVAQFGDTLDRLLDGIENFVANSRPTLGGERFLTDREVSERLKVSRRTLQDYRNNGVVSYYQLGAKFCTKNRTLRGCLPPITGRRSGVSVHNLPSYNKKKPTTEDLFSLPVVGSFLFTFSNCSLSGHYMGRAKRKC